MVGDQHCHDCERDYSLMRAASETASMRAADDDTCTGAQKAAVDSACRLLTKRFDEARLPKGFNANG